MLAQQTSNSAGPTPPAGEFPAAPLAGCVYLPNLAALTGFVGPMGLTCDATGALRVNVIATVGGAGGGGASSAYGPDATGTAPTKPPILTAGLDANGFVRPFKVDGNGVESMADALADAGIGAPGDTAATVGGNGSLIAQLKQEVTQAAAILAQLKTTLSTVAYAPNATTSGRTITKTALAASTNAQVCPAATGLLQSTEVQASAAGVGLGLNGQTLNAASYGTTTGNPDMVIPTAGGLYTPPAPPTNAITAYSANAAVVICIQTARQ